AVLDADSTAEAIAMLREAHTDTDIGAPATGPGRRPSGPGRAGTPDDRAPAVGTDNPQPPVDQAGTGQPATPAPTPGEHGAERVRVRVLGDPAVLDAAGQPAPKLRAKSLELLVYLAVNRSGASLSDIMEAIWPEATLRRAGQRLSTCVGNLRGVIRTVA